MQIIAVLTPLKQIREVSVCRSVTLLTVTPEQLMGGEDALISGQPSLPFGTLTSHREVHVWLW